MDSSLTRLQTFFGDLDDKDLLEVMIKEEFKDEIALVSSFGSGSAVLLAVIADVEPNLPVYFLETGKHFPETLEYVETLKNHLGLTNVKFLTPDPKLVNNIDSKGELWKSQPNRCCWLRKVEPLERELKSVNIRALITGRKRYQTPQRAHMRRIELHEDGRFRINPLASWTKERVAQEFRDRNLPEHPMVALGYPSIGCAPCTSPVKPGEDERAGRWAHTAQLPGGKQKLECGLHVEGQGADAAEKPEWDI